MATAKYESRCNDPAARDAWRESGLVRIDSLAAGDVFEDIDGLFWTRDRATRSGSILADPWGRDAEPGTFAACAMVRPVMRKTYIAPSTGESDGNA